MYEIHANHVVFDNGTDVRHGFEKAIESQDLMENRTDPRFAPSQWETLLQSNAVSHWLGANLESALENAFPDIGILLEVRRLSGKTLLWYWDVLRSSNIKTFIYSVLTVL